MLNGNIKANGSNGGRGPDKIKSPSGGGGAGSGGAVRFLACTVTAGSSAKIEAKGGNGGHARDSGTRLLCHVVLSCLFHLSF